MPPPPAETQDWIALIAAVPLGVLVYYLVKFVHDAYMIEGGKKP